MLKNKIFLLTIFAIYVVVFSACKEDKVTPVLRLVQLCDPQLGFGTGGFETDAANLEKAITLINNQNPDMVLITGDMINNVDLIVPNESILTFKNIIAQIKAPILFTPGNHDLNWTDTLKSLEHYRTNYGKDYLSVDCKEFCIISANSIFWWLEGSGLQEDIASFEQWLLKILQTAKNKKQPVIMMTHVPPFYSNIDEDDNYDNLPKTKRKELLDLFNTHGVLFWLAGHTHTTFQHNYGSITLLNGETTCRNFDNRPLGFRLLTIYSDNSFDWEFIPLN